MSEPALYRIVSDYGYGDNTWLTRLQTLEEVLEEFKRHVPHHSIETHDDMQRMSTDSIYYIEVDCKDDVEDWDWIDS